MDEKLAQAKELFSIATRNYYVKEYSDAVDDFSTVCSVYSEVYGPTADELGKPYLLYAKCLVALGQDENKLMDIPEEEDDDDSDEAEEKSDDKEEKDGESEEKSEVKEDLENGNTEEGSKATSDEPQPGTSSGIMASDGDEVKEEEDDDDVANLQLAWEVLELAVLIFSRSEDQAKNLAECYSELAGISFENSNFEAAIKDYNKSLNILQDLPDRNYREFAEIHYKIGLSYTMLNQFDDAKVSLQKAIEHLNEVIRIEETKEQIEDVINAVNDLKETRQEIENKIVEVEDYKQQSLEEVKRELSKLVGNNDSFDGAGPSTAGESSPSKPAADISHLIKRKKPADETPAAASTAASADSVSSPNDISHLIKRKK